MSVLALGLAGFNTMQSQGSQSSGTWYKPAPQTREFAVVTSSADFNETQVGIPHDTFTPNLLVVNQGDKVVIHFYNTEDKPEPHTFTLPAYNVNVELKQGQRQDITFTADKAGVFQFHCTYHLPTMSGELIVQPTY